VSQAEGSIVTVFWLYNHCIGTLNLARKQFKQKDKKIITGDILFWKPSQIDWNKRKTWSIVDLPRRKPAWVEKIRFLDTR